MTETGPGPGPEEIIPDSQQAEAQPEVQPEPDDTHPAERYPVTDTQERNVILRNAHAYLYDRERSEIKPTSSLADKARRTLKAAGLSIVNFYRGNIKMFGDRQKKDTSHLEQSSLDRALMTGTDPKAFGDFIDKEKAKGPGKADYRQILQAEVFRRAYEIRERSHRLIDELTRTDPGDPRYQAIEQQLNNDYVEIIGLAHTKSLEMVDRLLVEETIGEQDQSIPRRPGESRADWVNRTTPVTQKEVLDGYTAQDINPQLRKNKAAWHRQWIGQRLGNEYAHDFRPGHDTPIRTENELSTEVLEALREPKEVFAAVIEYLRTIPADEAEQHYGLRVSVSNPEAFYLRAPGKKQAVRCETSPKRELTVSLGNDAYAHISLTPSGFLRQSGDKIEVMKRPSSIEALRDEEYIKLEVDIVRPSDEEADYRYPRLEFVEVNPAQVMEGRLLDIVQEKYARFLADHPEAERRYAEQRRHADEERRRNEQQAAPDSQPTDEEDDEDE